MPVASVLCVNFSKSKIVLVREPAGLFPIKPWRCEYLEVSIPQSNKNCSSAFLNLELTVFCIFVDFAMAFLEEETLRPQFNLIGPVLECYSSLIGSKLSAIVELFKGAGKIIINLDYDCPVILDVWS